MPGKTLKKQSKRPASITEATKLRQKKARDRRAAKRAGLAATKRLARRAFLREKRLTDKTYALKLPPPDPKIKHEAKNTDSRGIDQLIYSCTLTPFRE